MIIGIVILAGILLLGLVLGLALRRMTLDEAALEARMHRPETHTVGYVVPTGQDPAVLMSALSAAGYTSVSDLEAGNERLLVEVHSESDRAQVRGIIEDVHRTSFEGAGGFDVAHVSFEDEA